MPDYFIFGGCLRSELSLPELVEAHHMVPSWTLRIGTIRRDLAIEVLSVVQPTPSCGMQLSRHSAGFRYAHSCSGTFEISPDGRTIVFEPSVGGDLAIARTDLVARVLMHCVDQGTTTWLHGSAVATGGRAVAFLGPSGVGKSTVALALARAGARHICDDTLPVEISDPPVVWPSDHTLRLRDDSRNLLAPLDPAVRRESDGKFIFTHAALAMVPEGDTAATDARVPLEAIYVLKGPPATDRVLDAPAVRSRLSATAAVPTLMQHVRLGLTVPPGMPVELMYRLGALARSIPVFDLWLARDWSRLEEVASMLIAWHAGPAEADVPSRSQRAASR